MKVKTGLKGHSCHSVPLLLVIKTVDKDGVASHEQSCLAGSIGTIYIK
jgi:2,3-bisphosphoglycerate-independent phosphoglycerate mutase